MERQFVCGTCGRRFSRVNNMRQHQKKLGHRLAPYTRSRGGRLKLIKIFESTLPRMKALREREYNSSSGGNSGISKSRICRFVIIVSSRVTFISLSALRASFVKKEDYVAMPSNEPFFCFICVACNLVLDN